MGQSIVRGTMVSQLGIGWWYECISHKGCAKVQCGSVLGYVVEGCYMSLA